MKAVIKIEKEVELKTLVVEAGVRYWEDATINDKKEDDYGTNTPCKDGDLWKPIIDLETGVITNWQKGKTARVHYKVCDAGSYYLQDAEGNTVLSIEQDYVPDIMCPEGGGYGDYIKMSIDENGKIAKWKQTLSGFQNED